MAGLPHNAFLRSLPRDIYERLSEQLTPVALQLGDSLQRDGDRVESVYFPETGLLSLISNTPNGMSIETSMVGNEGAAGLLEACGSGVSSIDLIVQVDGRALHLPAAACRALVTSDPGFAAAAWRFMELQMAESRQSALCQAAHAVEARCARWFLESHERSGGRNPLPMTQEFLAAMLGVQRTTVSAFASRLQRQGAINYRRGKVEIVDVDLLEGLACECRHVMVEHRRRLGLTPLPADGPAARAEPNSAS